MAPHLSLPSLLLCCALLAAPAVGAGTSRRLQQAPWLRVPAAEPLNPGRVGGALADTLFDNVGYGSLGFLGDFFDSSFELFQAGLADIGSFLSG